MSYLNLLQLVSNQFKTDKALENFIEIVIAAFDFVKDAGTLRDKAQNYAKTIDKLLQQTVEFCRFVKQYLNHGFFSEFNLKYIHTTDP